MFAEDLPHIGNAPQTTKFAWTRNFFIDFGILYNYEQIEPAPKFQSQNILFELALGYDFGRISVRAHGDFGFLLDGIVHWDTATEKILTRLDAHNGKFGIEAGFKIIDGENFCLIIPLGLLFNWTEYESKNPGYTQGYAYDAHWKYAYINLCSGINMSIKIGSHAKLLILSNIGYPISKEYKYEATLRDGYVWDTGSSTLTIKNDMDVFIFSAGIGLRMNF
jgi:hypothetical protein